MTTGMVLGKFLPPHAGHQYLIDFAKNYVDDLTLVVGTLASEPIAGELRYRWMKELYAGAGVRVVHLDQELPQAPEEHPDFWELWRSALRPLLPENLDYVFASEDYGWKLAEVLGADFVSVDISRTAIPVSGTAIRDQPLKHWDYLPRCVRAHFALRICIFGPESTGKSTLTGDLAKHYQTTAVPEYARGYIEARNGEVQFADMLPIARGQAASEDALARSASRLLFCDTDPLSTSIWSQWLFNRCDRWIEEEAARRDYAMTFLLDVDVPWVEDQVRYLPSNRKDFFETCEEYLRKHDRRYIVLSGGWDQRRAEAIEAIDRLLQ